MQLELFESSRGESLRNDVVHAIERRDAAAARSAWQALADQVPNDELLLPLGVLIGALDAVTDSRRAVTDGIAAAPDAGGYALREARRALQRDVEPVALRLLGSAAGSAWLKPMWRMLAMRAQSVPWRADGVADDHDHDHDHDHVQNHAAPLWLRAGDWQAAAAAVAGIASWRRMPAPLGWMAEARLRQHGLDEVWPLLAELAWLAPARFDALAGRLADPLLARLGKAFRTDFDGDGTVADWAWFPAWLLTEKPALAPLLAQAQPSLHSAPEVAMRLLLELLGLERQGRHADVVARRRVLRDTHAGLYAAYMRTR